MTEWNLDPSFKTSNTTLRFSISLLIALVHAALLLFSHDLLPWATDAESSMPCSWVNFLILFLALAIMRPRRRRFQENQHLKTSPSWMPLKPRNSAVSSGSNYLTRLSGIHSYSPFFHRISRDRLEVARKKALLFTLIQLYWFLSYHQQFHQRFVWNGHFHFLEYAHSQL